ncbi:MAG: hypothetical protein LBS31_10965 [Candidatus Adiutrix sp.]|nr:hypothetical protein [Candidatus Adiutrix sp.]
MSNEKKNWLTRHETSNTYNIPIPSLDRDRVTKTIGFPYVKIGRKVLYGREDMDAFFAARKRGGAA